MNIIHHTWNESFLFDYSANASLFIFYLFKIWFWYILNWKKAWIERVAEQGDKHETCLTNSENFCCQPFARDIGDKRFLFLFFINF